MSYMRGLCSVIWIHYGTKRVIVDVIPTQKRVAACRTRRATGAATGLPAVGSFIWRISPGS
eukprot:scaffold311317_cov35-Attheya_sp.AAC.1